MNGKYCFILLVSLLISGCGEVEWFPESSSTSGTSGTTTASPILIKSFNPAVFKAGDTAGATLTYTIVNGAGTTAQSGLGFTDQLSAGLSLSAASPQCGGTVSPSGSQLIFAGGSLDAGTTSCTITATVTSATAGSFTSGAAGISGLAGGLLNGVTDQTLTVIPSSVTSGTVTASIFSVFGSTLDQDVIYDITVQAGNTGAEDAVVTVDLSAIDVNGVTIPSTATTTFSEIVPAGTTEPIQLSLATTIVPVADAFRIMLWRIDNVTVE